jgi:hypothetical protein
MAPRALGQKSWRAGRTGLTATRVLVKQLCELLHWKDHHKVYQALCAVLHVMRDRLPVEEAVHLGAQLPMLVRGFYDEGWKPAALRCGTELKPRGRSGDPVNAPRANRPAPKSC